MPPRSCPCALAPCSCSAHFDQTMTPTLREISASLENVGALIWSFDGDDAELQIEVQNLAFQLQIRRKLQATVDNLVTGYTVSNNKQRNQWFSRIRVLLKLVFQDPLEDRYLPLHLLSSLRQLQPHALILCALSHTPQELKVSPDPYIQVLVKNLDIFLSSRDILQYFYVSGIEKYIVSTTEINTSCFKTFQTCKFCFYVALRSLRVAAYFASRPKPLLNQSSATDHMQIGTSTKPLPNSGFTNVSQS